MPKQELDNNQARKSVKLKIISSSNKSFIHCYAVSRSLT